MNGRKLTDRGVVYTGYSCNLDCSFCYYGLYEKKEHYDIQKINKVVETISKKHGNKKIDITGGEPTIHPDILEIVSFSKEMGLGPRIITNGILLEQSRFCKKLLSAGVDEFLISIHGPNEIHDLMTGGEGSFAATTKGIMNLNSLCIPFSSNTVVTAYNYHVLPKIAGIIFSLGALACNFIVFNPFESWADTEIDRVAIGNRKAAPYIKEALDICLNNGIKATVRYFPFCILRGYEQFICNFAQIPYDENEWDFRCWIRGEFPYSEKDYFNVAHMLNKEYYIESANCKNCGVRLICGGIKKKLASINLKDTEPYKLCTIEDPLYFKKGELR